MGHACARGLPNEYEEAIAGRLNGKWQPKRANKTAPAKEPTDSENVIENNQDVKGKPQQTEAQARQLEDDDFVNNLLRRANAGGSEERVAAAIAAAPEVHDDGDSDVSEDDGKVQRLLGGAFPASSSTAPVAVQDAMLELMNGRERLAQPQQLELKHMDLSANKKCPGSHGTSGLASLKAMGHSEQVVRAAARLGVLLPSTKEEDEAYGSLDAYVDDLLDIPHSQRPKGWQQRPSIVDSEAALTGREPAIIFGDGRRGPALDPAAQRESMREKQLAQVLETNVSVPDSGRPSLVGRPSVAGRPSWTAGATAPYLGNVLDGWASIDGEEAETKNQAPPDPAVRILPEINTLGALGVGAGAAGEVSRSHPGNETAPAAMQQPAAGPRGSFGKAMGMLRGAAPQNSFGTGKAPSVQDSSGASAQRATFGGMPSAPRDSSGGAGTALPRGSLRPTSTAAAQGGTSYPGSQQVEVSQRVADASRPAPKRKAQAR